MRPLQRLVRRIWRCTAKVAHLKDWAEKVKVYAMHDEIITGVAVQALVQEAGELVYD